MNRFIWRHQYDDAADAIERAKTDITIDTPSMTQQHHAESADLNVIVRRFGITDGAMPPAVMDPQYYGDFTDAPDFREALDRTHDAMERFTALPADIRNRFANDPVRMWQFVHDPKNDDEAVKMGLLKRVDPTPAPPTPAPVPAP